MGAIRGAICAKNTVEDISARSIELVDEIIRRNGLQTNMIQAILFTVTNDLDACYPATAVRRQLADSQIAYFCMQEMKVAGSLGHCIRVCMLVEELSQDQCRHCYMGEAAVLRTDLS